MEHDARGNPAPNDGGSDSGRRGGRARGGGVALDGQARLEVRPARGGARAVEPPGGSGVLGGQSAVVRLPVSNLANYRTGHRVPLGRGGGQGSNDGGNQRSARYGIADSPISVAAWQRTRSVGAAVVSENRGVKEDGWAGRRRTPFHAERRAAVARSLSW